MNISNKLSWKLRGYGFYLFSLLSTFAIKKETKNENAFGWLAKTLLSVVFSHSKLLWEASTPTCVSTSYLHMLYELWHGYLIETASGNMCPCVNTYISVLFRLPSCISRICQFGKISTQGCVAYFLQIWSLTLVSTFLLKQNYYSSNIILMLEVVLCLL